MNQEAEIATFRTTGDMLVKADDAAGGKLWIQGILSTESRDADGEIVLQNGLDFSYFLRHGWFNDNHDQSTGSGLGFPTEIQRVEHQGKPATRVVGYLLPTARGREVYELAKAAAAEGRPLGFSIEGGIMQRIGPDGKTVAKAIVRDAAIARHPKNIGTTLDVLAKALKSGEFPEEHFRKSSTVTAGYGGEAGDGGTGAPLVPQSLDGAPPATADVPLSMAEALSRVQAELGVTPAQARKILNDIMKGHKPWTSRNSSRP